MTKNKGKAGAKSSAGRRGGGGADMVSYRGPIASTPSLRSDAIRVAMSYTMPISSDAGGLYSAVITTATATTCSDWTNLAGAYKEARILGMKVRYEPNFNGSYNALALGGTGAAAVTHEVGAAAIAVTSQVYDKFGGKVWNVSSPLTMEWRMSDTGEENFTNSTTAADGGGVMFAIGGLTASRNYGSLFVTFMVEFRYRN